MGFERQLLFIVPGQHASPLPVVDGITRKMCAAFRKAKQSDYGYGGVHECYCGAASSSCDYNLPSGDLTNSLCVHYLAHHRAEVDEGQLAAVENFRFGEDQPSEKELQGPEFLLSVIRAGIERKLGPDRLHTWSEWGLNMAALSQGLRGGCLPAPAIYTQTRRDAQELFDLLCCIPSAALPCVQSAALRSYGDLAAWGADALCVSGWRRAAWMMPLADILRIPDSVLRDKRLVRMSRKNLERFIEEGNEIS
jgi:hypothetical protein